jgi:hypothetical protein
METSDYASGADLLLADGCATAFKFEANECSGEVDELQWRRGLCKVTKQNNETNEQYANHLTKCACESKLSDEAARRMGVRDTARRATQATAENKH